MNKEQYVKKILRHIKATDKTKRRIRIDILSDLESKEEQGLTLEEIIAQTGTPKAVAEEFNQTYAGTQTRRWYCWQRAFQAAGFVLLGGLVLFLLWDVIKTRLLLGEASSIGIIGGADGPTAIFVTGSLMATHLWAAAVCICLILCILCFALSLVIKKRK